MKEDLLRAMREAAMKATAGLWHIWPENSPQVMVEIPHHMFDRASVGVARCFEGAVDAQANAAHIALANPANILALLDALEEVGNMTQQDSGKLVERLRAVAGKRAPVQGLRGGIPWAMHLRAYDAYCKRWGDQEALIDLEGRNCRGGFGTEELDDFIPGWREELEVSRVPTGLATEAADEITRLQSALAERTGDGGWRPIADAPKDGTDFLALVPWRRKHHQMVGCFAPDRRFHSWPGRTLYDPTHWQPLPAPPVRVGGGEGSSVARVDTTPPSGASDGQRKSEGEGS